MQAWNLDEVYNILSNFVILIHILMYHGKLRYLGNHNFSQFKLKRLKVYYGGFRQVHEDNDKVQAW
jgi:hypothetical protein